MINAVGVKQLWGRGARRLMLCAGAALLLQSCADVDVPGSRHVNIPNPTMADDRQSAVNEAPDAVLYLPLGEDVLVPQVGIDDPLPNEEVGPFELRGETLAGALQLILSDYDISLAFESDLGLTRQITVANLRGPLNKVVRQICGLADLYCAYQDGLLVVKETQTFTVKIPPISQDQSFIQNVAQGLAAITGTTPIIDSSTRSIIYEASQRTSDLALRYFQRMRSSTALIVFETYIWEVQLNNTNSSGIKWEQMGKLGKFNFNIDIPGGTSADITNPISIGLPTTQGAVDGVFAASDVLQFLSNFGAVKTISQPQITVLSGSQARLRAADTQNFVAEISQTIDNGQSTTSVNTSSVDTGFTLTIGSAWDNATVYADIEIVLSDVSEIEPFDFNSGGGGSTTTVQLPKTTEREVATQVRIRPGDSLLIAGLVREGDTFNSSGPGFSMKPFFPSSRTARANNLELVFLLRPRVIVYSSPDERQSHMGARAAARSSLRDSAVELAAPARVVPSLDERRVVREPMRRDPSVPRDNYVPQVAPPPVAGVPSAGVSSMGGSSYGGVSSYGGAAREGAVLRQGTVSRGDAPVRAVAPPVAVTPDNAAGGMGSLSHDMLDPGFTPSF